MNTKPIGWAGIRAAAGRALLLGVLMAAPVAHASVIIVGTRVIYPAGARDVSVRLLNRGERPALIQAWLDRGDPKSTPETVSVPFALSPSLTRIDPDRGQVLRLVHTGETLPQDRESVFWLNMLEIPPKPGEADGPNVLQFALRTRIKVFYRPKGLKESPADAARALQWSMVRQGNTLRAEARNASGYFVSFGSFSLRADPKAVDALASAAGGMVAPGETQQFDFGKVSANLPAGAPVILRYTVIDDYGAFGEREAQLSMPPGDATVAPPPGR